LKGGGIAGQAHIKTGSLSDVRAIAGYVLDRSGRRYAVTMMVNHPNAQRSQAAQDALLNWVHSR
jgi:D-alanyl-D-alanine carboxypeptidase/D-alanyl-D-alanine-endopeptidase (penicillin-binding protein 4)